MHLKSITVVVKPNFLTRQHLLWSCKLVMFAVIVLDGILYEEGTEAPAEELFWYLS